MLGPLAPAAATPPNCFNRFLSFACAFRHASESAQPCLELPTARLGGCKRAFKCLKLRCALAA
eukprot:3910912-Alexandrium_andersonii.AAC.1